MCVSDPCSGVIFASLRLRILVAYEICAFFFFRICFFTIDVYKLQQDR